MVSLLRKGDKKSMIPKGFEPMTCGFRGMRSTAMLQLNFVVFMQGMVYRLERPGFVSQWKIFPSPLKNSSVEYVSSFLHSFALSDI